MVSKMFVTAVVLVGVFALTNAGFLDGYVAPAVGNTVPAVYTYRPYYQPIANYYYRPTVAYTYYPYRPYGYTYENNRVVVDGPGRRHWERELGQEGYY